jgi:hypothetical protein
MGRPPLDWSVAAGALPAGVTLGGDGLLAGTPTEAGRFPFTARVADTAVQSPRRTWPCWSR